MAAETESMLLPLLYVGIQGSVVAIRKRDGAIAWSTRLRKGSSFVPIVHEAGRVYAVSGGEVSCLDGASGELLWHNPLTGFGTGYASLAGAGDATSASGSEQAAVQAGTMSAIIAASAAGGAAG